MTYQIQNQNQEIIGECQTARGAILQAADELQKTPEEVAAMLKAGTLTLIAE